jgi:hypothetical protein
VNVVARQTRDVVFVICRGEPTMFRTRSVKSSKKVLASVALGLLVLTAACIWCSNEAAAVPPPKKTATPPKKTATPPKKTATKKDSTPSKIIVKAGRRTVRPAAAGGLEETGLTWNNAHFSGGFLNNINIDLTGLELTLRQDGSYTFTGKFHNNGVISYNTAVIVAVKDADNRVYTFTHQGHVQGVGDGSRDDFWAVNGTSPDVAANWSRLVASGPQAWASSQVNFDWGGMINSLKGVLGTIGTVISAAGPVIALL